MIETLLKPGMVLIPLILTPKSRGRLLCECEASLFTQGVPDQLKHASDCWYDNLLNNDWERILFWSQEQGLSAWVYKFFEGSKFSSNTTGLSFWVTFWKHWRSRWHHQAMLSHQVQLWYVTNASAFGHTAGSGDGYTWPLRTQNSHVIEKLCVGVGSRCTEEGEKERAYLKLLRTLMVNLI